MDNETSIQKVYVLALSKLYKGTDFKQKYENEEKNLSFFTKLFSML